MINKNCNIIIRLLKINIYVGIDISICLFTFNYRKYGNIGI
jgi:hypothetical protein